MNVITTAIDGVLIIEPRIFEDTRGYFFESFSQREFDEKVTPHLSTLNSQLSTINGPTSSARFDLQVKELSTRFVQDNESKSSYGVMRGLHFQRPPFTQSKLVRCVKGAVLDVAVDIRKGSPTYGQHVECLLCAHDEEGERIANEVAKAPNLSESLNFQFSTFNSQLGLQFFVPRGFAHGFAVLSETAVFQYKCDEFYHPEADGGISILDDSLGIDWHISTDQAILSDKDTKHSLLKDFDSPFDINVDLYK